MCWVSARPVSLTRMAPPATRTNLSGAEEGKAEKKAAGATHEATVRATGVLGRRHT